MTKELRTMNTHRRVVRLAAMRSACLAAALLAPDASAAFAQAPTAQAAAPAAPSADTEADASRAEPIVVTGTRAPGRTRLDTPVPVDVFSAADLRSTGAVGNELGQAIATLAPSVNFPRQSNSGTSDHIRAAQLRGLTPAALAGAAQAARERGHAAGWLLPLVLPTAQPVLAALDDRGLRERVHRASISRGARGGEHDTRALVSRITALRARRAALLGFPHHAAHVVDDQTAGDVATVMATLTSLVPAAAGFPTSDERPTTTTRRPAIGSL